MSLEEALVRLAKAQENSDQKMAALAAAQVRTEEEVLRLENAFLILTKLARKYRLSIGRADRGPEASD